MGKVDDIKELIKSKKTTIAALSNQINAIERNKQSAIRRGEPSESIDRYDQYVGFVMDEIPKYRERITELDRELTIAIESDRLKVERGASVAKTATIFTNDTLNFNSSLNFIAIDFETANELKTSVSSIGLAWVENGVVVKSKEILIKPTPNRFNYFNIELTGITPEMVADKPTIDEVWDELSSYLSGQMVVAHYTPFDIIVLRTIVEELHLKPIEFNFACSVVCSRAAHNEFCSHSLDSVCSELDITLDDHHNAEADAVAAAQIMIELCAEINADNIDQLTEYYHVAIGRFEIGDKFEKCLKKRTHHKVSVVDIVSQVDSFDETNYLYGKKILFTGTLSLTRTEAQQLAVNCGATLAKCISQDTNILVVGGFKYGDDFTSSKLNKAIKYKESGCAIEIITETDFKKYLIR